MGDPSKGNFFTHNPKPAGNAHTLSLRQRSLSAKPPGPATKPSIADAKSPALTGSANNVAPSGSANKVAPTGSADKVAPPLAKAASAVSPPPTQTPKAAAEPAEVPAPAAVKAPKKRHRFRNFSIGLTLLTVGSFAAGVFYSLKSDNVHDFFTEYVPFGEEAVLYFEEREFRRRFPNALSRIQRKVDSPRVTVPRASGATWKVVVDQGKDAPRTTDVGKPGPHLSSPGPPPVSPPDGGVAAPSSSNRITATVDKPADAKPVPAPPPPQGDVGMAKAVASPLAAAAVANPSDPVVQDLVDAVNNIIDTINNTNSGGTFGAAIGRAKAELARLNDEIGALKAGMEHAVQDRLREKHLEFAVAAEGLLTKVNNQVEDIQHQLRDEFEAERERIAAQYQRKLQAELEHTRQLAEQRYRNELLEQAIEMKRAWIAEIGERVETERGGRLGRLKELENDVRSLEALALQWNQVVDTSLRTQQTFTALEAVRASCEAADQPKPFLREMAALREVARDDDVIRAAIDSINPAAYQNGVATHSQLVERFRRLAGQVRHAALLPEDAGIAAHAGNWMLSKLMFKKAGLAQGSDVESILAKTETYLEEGNVDCAAREMNQLSGWARTLATDWLREARLVLEVQQALDVTFPPAPRPPPARFRPSD